MHAMWHLCTLIQFFSIKLKRSVCAFFSIFHSHHLYSTLTNTHARIQNEFRTKRPKWNSTTFIQNREKKKNRKCLATTWFSVHTENCLENVLNPKSIPWENCVTISQYSLFIQFVFLLLRFSWDCFSFLFYPCAKYPYFDTATFLIWCA